MLRSLRAIERADVSLLVVDATSGITAQDAHIAGFILDSWKSAVVVVNKWDAIPKETSTMDDFTRHVRQRLNFMDYVPVLFISAKTGQRVDKVLPLALQVQEERLVRLSTSQLNQIMQDAQETHPRRRTQGDNSGSTMAHRCAATHPLSCFMSMIQNCPILVTCGF